MNPYEKTAEEMRRQSEGPKRFAKAAGGIGTAIAAPSFAPMLARAAPFLSQYIPEDLAIKGLSKISPQFGKFIQDSLGDGYEFKEVKDFIGEQITDSQKEEPKQNGNIIKQYSPELHQFLDEQIRKGRGVLEAGADAARNKGFKNIISMITKDHKSPWSAILKTVYGEGLTKQQGVKQFNEHKKKNSLIDEEMQRFENGYGNNQQQQQGQGSAALMAILQKLQQSRGG